MTAPDAIEILSGVRIPRSELSVRPERPRGPGGQNVNKATSAAVLRFDLDASPSIPDELRRLARQRLASRLTGRGQLLLRCDTYRSWERNRTAVLDRFRRLLAEAMRPRRPRRPTAVPPSAQEQRLREKRSRARRKAWRRPPVAEE